MKLLSVLILIFSTQLAFASSVCDKLQSEDGADVQVLREGNVLTEENWKKIDVIVNFDRKECFEAVEQTLMKIDGKLYWRFATKEDYCDGGNTYGSIYSYDLKTPIAHIYDSDVYCKGDWREDEEAKYHKCDLKAEKFAKKKMKEFGFDFTNLSSSLEIRKPYIYSYIRVSGQIKNKGDRAATVNVLTNLDNCQFSSARIESLKL